MKKILKIVLACMIFGLAGNSVSLAEKPLYYHASVTAQASSKSLAPYMLGSWNEGRYVEGSGIWQEAGIEKDLDLSKRFSWSAGVDYIAGIASKTKYDRWIEPEKEWTKHSASLPNLRFQQLFAQIKYRQVYLTAGMKNSHSKIVDDQLSSGDLTRSNNALPIPGIAAGFIEYQDIPFTNGWIQIDGEIMYGKMLDSKFKRNEFNYYYGGVSQNLWYNYKRCYFRTNPEKSFYVTIGMQAAGLFAGTTYSYKNGEVYNISRRGFKIEDVFQMFIPRPGGEDYYTGSHLGTWDFKADYRFRDGSKLSAYFEWPWEDGSGIGRMNGWDGLWGLQYNFDRNGIVNKAVFEYLDFTNQSGPIHFDPEDKPDNPLTGLAQGADNYYNNDYYGTYSNYGMSIGSPFLVSPIHNRNGMLEYLHNRAKGFHLAVEGSLLSNVNYRLMFGYETAGGYGRIPSYKKSQSTSGMLEVKWNPTIKVPELEIGLRMAFDKGTLRGDNFGTLLQIAYCGQFKISKFKR